MNECVDTHEFDCGVDAPHEFEPNPADRWERGICVICGYVPEPYLEEDE